MSPFLSYLLSMVNVPYRWGGANPLTGLDCSGFILYVLKFTDFRIDGDTTAQGICNLLKDLGAVSPVRFKLGDIAFYGSDPDHITHVMMLIDDYRVIGATGGDSRVKTLEDAKARNACVRGERLDYRKDLVCVLRPPYTRAL